MKAKCNAGTSLAAVFICLHVFLKNGSKGLKRTHRFALRFLFCTGCIVSWEIGYVYLLDQLENRERADKRCKK